MAALLRSIIKVATLVVIAVIGVLAFISFCALVGALLKVLLMSLWCGGAS